ncbi:MAG TPA: urease accessory protein UreD [Steroidobacteraceae bacterium]|nr:urease accessory protein UreD [Steroidobacteraceae bacterium]
MVFQQRPTRVNAVAQAHQRLDGEARIAFRRSVDGPTRLADLYQRAPCRVLFPTPEADEPPHCVLLTTSGGLTGGDRTRVKVDVGANAVATVTTQAAEKIYRALPDTGDAIVEVDLRVGDGAWAEWLAQETIVFEGSRLRRGLTAEVAPGGRLLAVESVVFGRTAMGERFDTGLLHDAWRIRRGGRLVWVDALHLEGDVGKLRVQPFSFGNNVACATVLYASADATQQIGEARRLLGQSGLPCGATLLDGIMVARIMTDDATELRATVMRLVAGIRQAAASLPARLPRVWHC